MAEVSRSFLLVRRHDPGLQFGEDKLQAITSQLIEESFGKHPVTAAASPETGSKFRTQVGLMIKQVEKGVRFEIDIHSDAQLGAFASAPTMHPSSEEASREKFLADAMKIGSMLDQAFLAEEPVKIEPPAAAETEDV